jgi:hypothetical protein
VVTEKRRRLLFMRRTPAGVSERRGGCGVIEWGNVFARGAMMLELSNIWILVAEAAG